MTQGKKAVWIFGAGRFGRQAFEVLRRKYSDSRILIVDTDSDKFSHLESEDVSLVRGDAVEYLKKNLARSGGEPRWIIPAVPIHLAFEWVKARLGDESVIEQLPVPEPVIALLPNPAPQDAGPVYMSYADFICPPDCPQPARVCTYTQMRRPGVLHEHLTQIEHDDFRSVVITSRQLAPGVGGYSPQALYDALDEIRNSFRPILFSTACACHGVMHAIQVHR